MKAELLERVKEQQTKENRNRKRKKTDRYRRKDKSRNRKTERIWDEIENCLEEMETELEEIPFDEFTFLKNDILQDREKNRVFLHITSF